jgi:hypothetical protein
MASPRASLAVSEYGDGASSSASGLLAARRQSAAIAAFAPPPPKPAAVSLSVGTDEDDEGEESIALQALDDPAPGVTQVPGSTRSRPVGMMVAKPALAVPRPTSVFSATVLHMDPTKGGDRISNQLEVHGNKADATTQIDPRAILNELPSQKRLKQEPAYKLRMGMETSMPYQPGIVRTHGKRGAHADTLTPGVCMCMCACVRACDHIVPVPVYVCMYVCACARACVCVHRDSGR